MSSNNIPRLPRTQERTSRFQSAQTTFQARASLEDVVGVSPSVNSWESGLLAGLSWLPTKVDAIVVVSEAIADLIRGLSQLLEAFLGLSAVILIAALLVLGLLALSLRFISTDSHAGSCCSNYQPADKRFNLPMLRHEALVRLDAVGREEFANFRRSLTGSGSWSE